MTLFDNDDNIVICPKCGAILDRYTLYSMDCFCIDCGHFIDVDEMEEREAMEGWENSRNYWDDDYWDNYEYDNDDYYIEMMKRKVNRGKGSEDMLPALKQEDEDEVISTFVIRFLTTVDYQTIKTSFEKLEADIDYMKLNTDGPLTKFLNTKGGEKLAQGMNIKKEDLDEYVLIASFIFGDEDESKKILVSTLCQSFPLCVIREEESSYIMANNKGLAKGMSDICNEDEIELLSLFLTGYEKFLILKYFLYWCDPYKSKQAKEIMIKWDNNSLVSLEMLRKQKTVPTIWQQYLAGLDEIKVSGDTNDNGKNIAFEQMLEDVVSHLEDTKNISENDNIINLISLRGMAAYSLYEQGETDSDIKS